MFQQQIGYKKSVGSRLGKGTGESGAVADGVQPFGTTDFKVFAIGTGRIVFALDAIKEGIVVGGAGCNFIQSVKGFDDVVQLPFGEAEAQRAE